MLPVPPFTVEETFMSNHCRTFLRGLLAGLALGCAALSGAADAAGSKACVGNFKDDTVSVTGDGSSSLSVIDTATDSVVATVEVGKAPHGVALTPDGKGLLVAVNGEDKVAFVDLASQRVAGSVAVGKPHTIAVRPDGKLAYVASQVPGQFAIVEVDLATRAVVRSLPLPKPPRDLEFGHDGKALYFTEAGVNAVQVLDPATDKIVAEVPTGASPHYANFFRNTTMGIAVIQGPGELLLFDPQTNQAVRSIAVGKQPHWVTVSSDGKTAYVPNEGSNDVSIVDLASGKVSTVAVGNAPRKVVVQPARGAKVSISNFSFLPPVVTLAPGDTVTWTNDDGAPHALAFKDGSPGAKSLLPGASFARGFSQVGSYEYFCSVHPYMTGRVQVVAPSS